MEYQIPKATVTTFANAFAHALLSAALEKKDALSAEEAAKAAEAAAAQVSDKTANATEPTKAAESAATEQTGTAENGAAGSEAAAAAPAPAAAETSATAVHAPRYDDIFTKASETYGVDKKLLMAVARVESAYTADAVSSAGAMGVMQLMPATAEAMGVPNAFDPEQNIMGGAKLLSILLNKYSGNTTLALAAYNAGGGAVDRAGGVPSEGVQRYVDKVLGYYSGS